VTDPQQNPFPVFFPGFPATVEAQQQERLHGMVLTRGEAEQVADRLATGLAGALNQLRRLS